MKFIAVSVGLSVLTIGRLQAQSEIKEQLVVPLSEPGKPCKIVAHVLNGSLKVVGYEGKEVVVNVTAEAGQKKESSGGGGMKRIGGNSGGDVTAEEDHNTVKVSVGLSHFSVIEVKVPSTGVTLNIGTVNDGRIEVENVNGQLEVSNVNGPITLTNIAGSAVATTVNGDVVVGFRSVDPQAPMAFSTLNGKIDVTFPASLKAKVRLKSEKGDIFTDFDVAITKNNPTVNKSNEGHMSKITIDDWVLGTINGGGPELMMKTTYGGIFIRKAK
jgi:hypothetical protein